MPGLSSVFDGSVVSIRKKKRTIFNSVIVRKELKWHKAGRKGAKKDISRAKVGSPASRKNTTIAIDRHEHFGSVKFVIKNSNQRTFLNNSREAEKENA